MSTASVSIAVLVALTVVLTFAPVITSLFSVIAAAIPK